jgi:hypothetical protein
VGALNDERALRLSISASRASTIRKVGGQISEDEEL